jgi:hypothetical protein
MCFLSKMNAIRVLGRSRRATADSNLAQGSLPAETRANLIFCRKPAKVCAGRHSISGKLTPQRSVWLVEKPTPQRRISDPAEMLTGFFKLGSLILPASL